MPLFQLRQKRNAKAAGGVATLTERFPSEARVRLILALFDHIPPAIAESLELNAYVRDGGREWLIGGITRLLTREWGKASVRPDRLADFIGRDATDKELLDVIESWFVVCNRGAQQIEQSSGVYYGDFGSPASESVKRTAVEYRQAINDILDDFDLAWQLSGSELVPRSSMAMHATIVEPVLTLTSGDGRLAGVEKSYRKALQELKASGDPSDAITDAGRALQEMLEAIGAKGNALGPLLADARRREFLSAYDSKLAEAVDLIGAWVSADRSQRGDAHNVREASRDDAWLAVRIAGALILRLAAGKRR